MLSAPNSGPTVLCSRTLIDAGRAPALRSIAKRLLSSTVKSPVIIPEPPGM